MKMIQALALLGAVLIAACSERQSATGPTAEAAALTPTAAIGDRPYTWSLSCGPSSYLYATLDARWYWTTNGFEIAGSGGSGYCVRNSKVSGTGVRPGSADGFHACVGYTSCQSWTFDPAEPFSAQLKGSAYYPDPETGCPLNPKCKYFKISGSLSVDS